MAAAFTQPPCRLTQQKLDEKNWTDGRGRCLVEYGPKRPDGTYAVCGEPYANHSSSTAASSSSSITDAPPTAHQAVINNSLLSACEKAELIALCCEKSNWPNAESIAVLSSTDPNLDNNLLAILEFLRKKYKTPPSSATKSESKSTDVKTNKQKDMKARMIDRNLNFHGLMDETKVDECRCDICGVIGHGENELINSHIVPKSFRHEFKEAFFNRVIPDMSPYVPANGLLLCRDCDKFFEDHIITIDGKGVITIGAPLLHHKSKEKREKYSKMNEKTVGWVAVIGSGYWPSKELLDYRNTLPTAYRKKFLSTKRKLEFNDGDVGEEEAENELDEMKMEIEKKKFEELLKKKDVIASKDIVSSMKNLKWVYVARNRIKINTIVDVESVGRTTLGQFDPPLMEHDVGGEGNCTFLSIVDQIRFHDIRGYDDYDHSDLRELFRACCRSNTDEMNRLGVRGTIIDGFSDGVWNNELGDLVVFVLARALGLHIRIIHGPYVHQFNFASVANAGKLLTVVYNGHHYRSTRPSKQPAKKRKQK